MDTYDSIQAILKMKNGCYWTVENSCISNKKVNSIRHFKTEQKQLEKQ